VVQDRQARTAAVVVLTYRAPEGLLEQAIDALLAAGGPVPIVVDNGGAAGERLGDRRVDLVESPRNDGYGAGMNRGMRRAFADGATYVALLNDDVIVEPGWLDAALDGFDSPSVGAVQPLLLDLDGTHVNSAGVTVDRAGQGADVGRGAPAGHDDDRPQAIDAFTGGAVVVSRAFIDAVGGFDERFFLYYEDVELSRRGRRLGWSYRLAPASRVRHVGSASTAALGDRVRYLQERNRLWCVCMCGSPGELGRALWLSVRRLRHRPVGVHARALAVGVGGGLVRLGRRLSEWRESVRPRAARRRS
jgi:GT2 family glycosyltransferase